MSERNLSFFSPSSGDRLLYSRVTPAFSARIFKAPLKSTPSTFSINEKASPPSPQPKQCQLPRSGETWKEGVFSLWNGQRPRNDFPALVSFTYGLTTSLMERRSLISATVSRAMV